MRVLLRRVVPVLLAAAIAAGCAGCDAIAMLAPASAVPSQSPSTLSEADAVRTAFEIAGWKNEPPAEVSFARLMRWGDVPVLTTNVDRMPTSMDHPVWFVSLWLDPGPAGTLRGAGLMVLIDAVDGHAIETLQEIE
jgi:hypothetical protein